MKTTRIIQYGRGYTLHISYVKVKGSKIVTITLKKGRQ